MADITVIPGNQCIGDSLATINNNFAALNNFILPTTTTILLTSIGSSINIENKFQGKLVYNTTNKNLYVADGSNNSSRWYLVNGVGTTYYTPA